MKHSLRYATAQGIGRRREQQDRLFARPSLGIFGVFDGHRKDGALAAERAAKSIVADLTYRYDEEPGANIGHRLTHEFARASAQMLRMEGGATATVAAISPINPSNGMRTISVNNVGNSPAFLIDPSNPNIKAGAQQLTKLHSTGNPKEIERMAKLGVATFAGRDGTLYFEHGEWAGTMNSRALGDTDIKGIKSKPYCSWTDTSSEQLLLLATDGVLSPSTTKEAIEDTVNMYKDGKELGYIAYNLVTKYSKITGDNASAVIVHIPGPNSLI